MPVFDNEGDLILGCSACGAGLIGDEEESAVYREGRCYACQVVFLTKLIDDMRKQNSKLNRVAQLTRIYLENRAPHILDVLVMALRDVGGRLPGERNA